MIRKALALCLAGAMLVSCDRASAPLYATTLAAIGDVRDVVPAAGSVRALSQVEVRADTPGRIIEVLVEANAPVRAGQILARLQPDRLMLDVEGARAEYIAARAAVTEARARATQSERNLQNRRVLAEQGFISPAALNGADAEARAAAASVVRAEADAARARVRVRSATAGLGDVLIRAPADGFVLSRAVELGQVVAIASEKPLFVIASDMRRVMIEALVAEPDIGRINRDVRVAFSVEAYPGRIFSGEVRDILRAPQKDRAFVSYPVLIEADNADGKLLPGMTASVEFIHTDARQVLRAPIEALYFTPEDYVPDLPDDLMRDLRRRGLTTPEAMAAAEMGTLFAVQKHRIFVLEAGKPVARPVRVGAQSSDFVEIVEGLKAGEVVITSLVGTTAAESGIKRSPS